MIFYACSDMRGKYGYFLRFLEKIRFTGNDKMIIFGDVMIEYSAFEPVSYWYRLF